MTRDKARGSKARDAVAALLEAQKKRSKADQSLIDSLQAEVTALRKQVSRRPKAPRIRKSKAAKHIVRVFIPDSHGAHIDPKARAAFLSDCAEISPDEIVFLGDHLDCGGVLSSHPVFCTSELRNTYEDDVAATNDFLDSVQLAAPNAEHHYLEGNHEERVERFCSKNFHTHSDAEMILGLIGPQAVLRLKERDIRYYRRNEFHHGLTVNGVIRLGECYVTHGMTHAKNAAQGHLDSVGSNIVFGHVHRAISVIGRKVTAAGIGAWCPGTLAKLQPLYFHTHPSTHSHGYGLQFVNKSTGRFVHFNVPIIDGVSMLRVVVDHLGVGKRRAA